MYASDLGIKRQRVGPAPPVAYDVNLLQQMVNPPLGTAPFGIGVDAFGVPGVGLALPVQGDNNDSIIRGRWTKDEDDKLRSLCLGQTNIAWQRIAEQIDGRAFSVLSTVLLAFLVLEQVGYKHFQSHGLEHSFSVPLDAPWQPA